MSGSEELKSYILSSREMSISDNVIGSKMHWGILRSIQESATMLQPNSISPETLLLLLRKRTRSARSVPAGLQMELALLWRTLGILRYSVGIPGVLQSFYQDLLATIIDVDALSLSNFNERCETTDNQRNKQGSTLSVSFDNSEQGEISSAGKKRTSEVLFPVPELAYLTENSEFEGDDINDPLAIVQKLFNSSESFASAVPASERSAMHSVCLALAVKSGRLSLLLQSALMLVSEEKSDTLRPEQTISNLQILSDIVDYLMIGNDYKDLMLQVASKRCPQSFPTSQYLSELISKVNTTDASTQNFKKFIDPAVCHTHENSSKRITLSFGKADHGKLGLGDSQFHRLVPTMIDCLQGMNITKISSMGTTTIAIDDEGVVRMWGAGGSAGGNSNVHTNLSGCTYGYGLHDHRLNIHPQLVSSIPFGAVVVDISCGLGHALFLLKTGCVWSSGSGGNGRLGLGDTSDRKDPCLLVSLLGESVSAVQCGASHSLALTSTGRVYSWGKNSQGQCGTGHLGEVLRPVPCKALSSEKIVQVAAGWEHSIALTDRGAVYSWGCGYKDNRRGIVPPVLGLGDNNGRTVPERLRAFDTDNTKDLKSGPKLGIFGVELEPYRIVSIACGWDHCLALDNGGKVRAWGSGQNGKLGRGNEESAPTPSFILALDHVCVVSISAGCEHSAAVTDEGVIYTWGHGDGGRLGHGDNEPCLLPKSVYAMSLMGLRPLTVHCGDKFTTVTCYTENSTTKNVKNVDMIRRKGRGQENTNINMTTDKINNKDRNLYNLTEIGYYEKMDDTLEKYQNKKGNFVVSEKREIPDLASENSEKIVSHEDVGNVLLSLLARVSDLQIRNLDLTQTGNSDICDIDNYTDRIHSENGPEKPALPPSSVSQLGFALPYGIECTHVTFGCLLTVIEKDYFMFCEDLNLSSNPAEIEKMKKSGDDMEEDNRESRIQAGTFRGSKNGIMSAEFPSPSRTPDIFRRGIRRASSNMHEAKMKPNDNTSATKGYLVPRYFSTPSTPPSHAALPVLPSIDPRAFLGGKPLLSPVKTPHRILFTSFGPLLSALTILKSNLRLLCLQISLAEGSQSSSNSNSHTAAGGEGGLRESSCRALEVDVDVDVELGARGGSAVHCPDWIGSPTQSDVNEAVVVSISDIARALDLDTEGHTSSPGPIFYTEERERERERQIRREGGRSGEDEAWEDHLRSHLLEQTTAYEGPPRLADIATSPPLGSQPAIRVGSAGGVSVGSVLSQLERSGRLATSRRGSGVLLIPPGVPLSSAVAIAARLQQGQEGQEEKEDGGDMDGGEQDLGEIGRQFRSLMLQDEQAKGNHFNDDYRFNLSNNTGGTMSPVDGIFEGDHFYLGDSLRASLDYSVKSSEGKRDRDYSHDTTPQIVQREGRALIESLEADSEGDEVEEKEDERVKEREMEREREREAQGRGPRDYTGDTGMKGLGIAGLERKETDSEEGRMVAIGDRGRGDTGGDRSGGGGEGVEDREMAGFKMPLNTTSFDSLLGAGSDHSNSNSNEDIQSLVDIDCNNDMGDDLEGPENVELQQAILRSIVDSGDDPRSGSHYRTEDAYLSLPRLKAILVDLALHSSEALDTMQRTYDRMYGPYSACQDDDRIAPGKSVRGKGSYDANDREIGGVRREKGEEGEKMMEKEKERERRLSIDSFAPPSSTSLCARASFSIWQKVQGVLSKGLEALYSLSERRTLLLDIIHSPSTMKHVLCGVCTALHRPSNKSQNIFHTLSNHYKRDVAMNTPLFYQQTTGQTTFADDDFESISVPEIINFIKHIRAGHLSDKVTQIFPRNILENFGPEDGIYPKQSPFGTSILFYEGTFLRSITAYSLFRFLRSILAPALTGNEILSQEGKDGKDGNVSPTDNLNLNSNLNTAGSDCQTAVLNLLVDCLLIDLKAIFNSEMCDPTSRKNSNSNMNLNSISRSSSAVNNENTSDFTNTTTAHAESEQDMKSALNCTFSGTVLPFLAVRYTQNEKIKSIEIFLPHALSLLKLFHGFTTTSHTKSLSSASGSRSRAALTQWLENKMKWVRARL